ncbi:hypothetical protein V5R04_15600 [Jonesiaceae bacterium BS-20]|uniref:Uncharacterized protein n=1 Tax=Jonesiaceae bacterium BS-20 TaxID=3120821 RepID=A0AAU7DV84_9MICO
MAEIKITSATFDQAFKHPEVKKALARRAAIMLPRAKQQAAKAGRVQLAKALRVESGTRPGTKSSRGIKRPFARLMATYPEEARKADAGSKTTARMIMRRAAR